MSSQLSPNTVPTALGRPALPEGEARSTYIKVRVSEEDKIAFFAECESHCQNPSAVLRMLMDQYISEGGIS